MNTPIRYRIVAADPRAHLFHVTLTIADPDVDGCCVSLPAWIPGSYMIREFARHIVRISARAGRLPVALTKIDKHTWQAASCKGVLTIAYEVYAWDLSVRAAHLDESHGFFNGTSVFLRVQGREAQRHEVDIAQPSGRAFARWRVATSLPCARSTQPLSFGHYAAANYDELIDHPVEMGDFTLATFTACGVPHQVVITGLHDCDTARLTADLVKICEAQIRLFHGARAGAREGVRSAPFDRYVFLVLAVGDGYGGLEHRASTALICSRNDLPYTGMKGTTEGYRTFLGLCSHEYFHAWNVKRIRPAAFTPYDLTQENYTRLLWAFEGITSYYDDLILVRCGLITLPEYLETLARTIRSVLRGPGRLKQPVAESSFDAWVKYYRQDENAPNAIVSYYAKGALVALCLDLMLREGTAGARSLDDVMRLLWRDYGARDAGVPEDGIERAVVAVVAIGAQFGGGELGGAALKHKLTAFFREAVHGTRDLPLAQLLGAAGFKLTVDVGTAPALGVRTASAADGVRLTHVLDGGGAQLAGLSAGDVMLAIDGIKVSQEALERRLGRKARGAKVRVHAFRRDELISRDVILGTPEVNVKLERAA